MVRAPASFGVHLRGLREGLGLSMRDVERLTAGLFCKAYLSRIERGLAESPSVVQVAMFAVLYRADYLDLCRRACPGASA